tara:strand:+ start:336 stop:524 length:189 start_codon:yes stop_codon:yes gene_type:complete
MKKLKHVEIDVYKLKTTKHPKLHSFHNVTIKELKKFVNDNYKKWDCFQVYDTHKFVCNIDNN